MLTFDADQNKISFYTLYYMVNSKQTKHNGGYLPVVSAASTYTFSRYLGKGTIEFLWFECLRVSSSHAKVI